jgi:hypothetical protein
MVDLFCKIIDVVLFKHFHEVQALVDLNTRSPNVEHLCFLCVVHIMGYLWGSDYQQDWLAL